MGFTGLHCSCHVSGHSGRYRTVVQSSAGEGSVSMSYRTVVIVANQCDRYSFSTSASIAISEFLKLGISTVLFSRTCLTRFKDQKDGYRFLEDNNTLLHDYGDKRASGESEESSASRLDQASSPDDDFDPTPFHKHGDRYLPYFLSSCTQEVSSKHIIAYGHLALLYALINNTVGTSAHERLGSVLTPG